MQSTQPSSDEWSDDAIKMLLEYGGWRLLWEPQINQWLVYVSEHSINAASFDTLQEVHAYYLDHMKWVHSGYPEPEDDDTPDPP